MPTTSSACRWCATASWSASWHDRTWCAHLPRGLGKWPTHRPRRGKRWTRRYDMGGKSAVARLLLGDIDAGPAQVRIELCDTGRDTLGVGAEVFLEHYAILIDRERHNA